MKPQHRLTVVLLYLLSFVGALIVALYLMDFEGDFYAVLFGLVAFILVIIIYANFPLWMRKANKRVAKNRRKMTRS